MKRSVLLAVASLAVAVSAAACGGANGAQSSPSATTDPGAPRIVAADLKFGPAPSVTAGTAFGLVFENRDGAPHNVAIASDGGFSSVVFRGDVVTGSTVTYQVPALAAGTYWFRCDVHPDMTGTLVAG
ncbi:MAG TPA: cupredoxin domain-containing protein [Candidatus Limnocylindrales bacterium]|nr:cupredoxin domain-containing protein [Candidatus Limnocylindrales bacterium]